jgi:FKBP-type peptidyl-prolyl cis-trans isomerase 2
VGNIVKAAINGKTEKGEEFMSTAERPEMEFVVGKAQLTPGVDAQVVGMSIGEKKSFTVSPSDGFGGNLTISTFPVLPFFWAYFSHILVCRLR